MMTYNAQGARNIAVHHRMDALDCQLAGDQLLPLGRLAARREQIQLASQWRRLEALCRMALACPSITPPHEEGHP